MEERGEYYPKAILNTINEKNSFSRGMYYLKNMESGNVQQA
jgi:hypothetical protein